MGLGTVQRLDARLLVHAEHHGVFRRLHVQCDHLQQFLLKLRVRTEGKGAQPMRMQIVGLQDPLHARVRQPQVPRQRAHTPATESFGRLRANGRHHLLLLALRLRHRTSGAGTIFEPRDTVCGKAPTPLADNMSSTLQAASDLGISHPLCCP
jgi:hypothetical protein